MEFVPSIGVLIIKNGKVLLVKHTQEAGHLTGTYGIPSGRIDHRESEKQAAVRELFEETGLKTSEEDLAEFPENYCVAEIERKEGGRKKFGMRVFLCRKYSGDIKASRETIPQWTEITEMEKYNLLPNIKNVTIAGLKYLENV